MGLIIFIFHAIDLFIVTGLTLEETGATDPIRSKFCPELGGATERRAELA